MKNIAEFVAEHKVKGFFAKDKGQMLYDFGLRAENLCPCLEIGSYCGKSALYLGSACKISGNVLFSIDHHCGSEEQQPGEAYFDAQLFDERIQQVNSSPAVNLKKWPGSILCRYCAGDIGDYRHLQFDA